MDERDDPEPHRRRQARAGSAAARFVQTMVGLGLTAPFAAQMLAAAGVAQAQPKARRRSRRPSAAAAGR